MACNLHPTLSRQMIMYIDFSEIPSSLILFIFIFFSFLYLFVYFLDSVRKLCQYKCIYLVLLPGTKDNTLVQVISVLSWALNRLRKSRSNCNTISSEHLSIYKHPLCSTIKVIYELLAHSTTMCRWPAKPLLFDWRRKATFPFPSLSQLQYTQTCSGFYYLWLQKCK